MEQATMIGHQVALAIIVGIRIETISTVIRLLQLLVKQINRRNNRSVGGETMHGSSHANPTFDPRS